MYGQERDFQCELSASSQMVCCSDVSQDLSEVYQSSGKMAGACSHSFEIMRRCCYNLSCSNKKIISESSENWKSKKRLPGTSLAGEGRFLVCWRWLGCCVLTRGGLRHVDQAREPDHWELEL